MKYSIEKNKAGKFAVKKEGAKRASKVFDTEIQARDYVKKQGGTIDEMDNITLIAENGHKLIKWIIIVIIALLGIGGGATAAVVVINNNKPAVEGVVYDGFQAHVLMLGNEYVPRVQSTTFKLISSSFTSFLCSCTFFYIISRKSCIYNSFLEVWK